MVTGRQKLRSHKQKETRSTLIPSILALEESGFSVRVSYFGAGLRYWAIRGEEVYESDSPEALLGISKLVELRGQEWQASDEEIRSIAQRHPLLA
jgi:hypothetical protein